MKKTSVLLIVATALLSACASKPTYNANHKPTIVHNAMGVPNYHLVKHGDTVSRIAAQYQLNWRDISRLNGLDSNNTIYVGQWLMIWKGNPQATPATKTTQSKTQEPVVQATPTPVPVPTASKSTPVVATDNFVYPVDKQTQIVREFGAVRNINGQDVKSEGVWFMGRDGDAVMAVKAGTVIYADSNDVPDASIGIRHADGHVSEYRFIKNATIKAGQTVQAGQRIASMKPSQNGVVVMEFRLSKNNVYINPLSIIK